MISTIKLVLTIVLGISLLVLIIASIFPTLTNVSLSNVSIGFALNETAYSLNNSIYTSAPYTPLLRYANGTTNVTNYTFTSSTVSIGANIPNGTSYYGYYTYYNKAWMGGNDYSWVIAFVLFISFIAVALKFLNYI
jgi:hypothetical protein